MGLTDDINQQRTEPAGWKEPVPRPGIAESGSGCPEHIALVSSSVCGGILHYLSSKKNPLQKWNAQQIPVQRDDLNF